MIRILRKLKFSNCYKFLSARYFILEPDYLDPKEVQIPKYPLLNVQLKGYDFTVLEDCMKFIHKIAKHLNINVTNCWATPCQVLQHNIYKPGGTSINDSYILKIYERNLQISELKSITAPIFFDIIHTILPEGVQLSIHEHQVEHEDSRYIPDLELKQLRIQLEDLEGVKKEGLKK